MRIYEASIAYSLVTLGEVSPVNTPSTIVEYLRDAYEKTPLQESFWVICLDRKNKPISRTMISLGSLTSTVVHPREVFKVAILASAAAIVVSHNHPSGDPAPSSADVQVTRQVREAAKFMGIDPLDHVIVGHPADDPQHRGYYSFREAGMV